MREIKLKTGERKLYINELEGAILMNNGQYAGYKSHAIKGIGFLKPEVSRVGEGITSLRTQGVLTCAGIVWTNKNNHVIIHARYPENLEKLFPVLWEESVAKANGCSPLEIYLFRDFCADNYEKVLNDFMENKEINFNVNNVYGRIMATGGGSCEIGPNVLNFEGNDVNWYGQKPKYGFSIGAELLRALVLKEDELASLSSSRIQNV